MNAMWIGLSTLIVALLAIGIALCVGRSKPVEAAEAARQTYRARKFHVIVLGTVLALAAIRSLAGEVYPADEPGEVVVDVTGRMWSWQIDGADPNLPVGKRIEFRVMSTDVNHGFGVYDGDGRLLFQVQAMPGKTNRVYYTFDRPGTYQVLCMEFCGVVHHLMARPLEVL